MLKKILNQEILTNYDSIMRANKDHYILFKDDLRIHYKRKLDGWRAVFIIEIDKMTLLKINIESQEKDNPNIDFWDKLVMEYCRFVDVERAERFNILEVKINKTLGD